MEENGIGKPVGGEKDRQRNDPEDKIQDYEQLLDSIGFGKTQWIMLLTSGLLLMLVINETMGMSIITIASQCDFATSSVDKAVMSAASFVGILFSSYFWGHFSDTIGRRTILLHTTFIGNLISLVSMFIPNYWVFVFLRLLTGICIAGASSTTYAYLGEFFVARHRPVVINYASMFVGFAMVYMPVVAWGVLSYQWSFSVFGEYEFRPWRLLILCNVLPGLVAVLILLKLPESPKVLLSLGRETEALAAVHWIYKTNTGTSRPLKLFRLRSEMNLPRENVLSTKTAFGALKKMWQETRPLFRRPHVWNFLISCIVMCGLFFSSSGMGLWYPEIQNRVGLSSDESMLTVCQVIDASMDRFKIENSTIDWVCDDTISTKSYMDSITFGLSYVVGYILLGIVIRPLGRKLVILGALVISGTCGIALLWILDPVVIVVVFCLFLVPPGLCVSVVSGAVVDLVPTHLRGKAVCICLMLGRSGSVIGSNIIGVLLESYCDITFAVFSGFVFFCALLTCLLPI